MSSRVPVGPERAPPTHVLVGGVEDLHQPLHEAVALLALLLAEQLDLPQLPEVEVPLLLHALQGQLQRVYLQGRGAGKPSDTRPTCLRGAQDTEGQTCVRKAALGTSEGGTVCGRGLGQNVMSSLQAQ